MGSEALEHAIMNDEPISLEARAQSATQAGGLVRPQFVQRMEEELVANAHKGDWREWQPTREQAIEELHHHVEKLRYALILQAHTPYEFRRKVGEFSADVANVAMKIDECYGGARRDPHARQRFRVPPVDGAWEPGYNCDPTDPPTPFMRAEEPGPKTPQT